MALQSYSKMALLSDVKENKSPVAVSTKSFSSVGSTLVSCESWYTSTNKELHLQVEHFFCWKNVHLWQEENDQMA